MVYSLTKKLSIRHALPIIWTLVVSACGGNADDETVKENQFERKFGKYVPRETWLFVVDTSADVPGAAIRERFAHDFAAAESIPCGLDEAAWSPIHRKAVLAFSSTEGTVYITPSQNPKLSVLGNSRTSADLTKWSEAVAEQIISPPEITGTNAPLMTLNDATRLLTGLRPPASDTEREVVNALGSADLLAVSLITSRDDESRGEPEEFTIRPGESLGSFRDGVVVLAAVVPDNSVPRLDAWAEASNISLATVGPDSSPLYRNPCSWTAQANCMPTPLELPSGQMACRLYATSDHALSCAEEQGLMPVTRADALEDIDCELHQLEGRALASCQTDLSCADCEPGFCIPAIPDLVGGCNEQGQVAYPRIIAGAGDVLMSLRFHLICDRQPP